MISDWFTCFFNDIMRLTTKIKDFNTDIKYIGENQKIKIEICHGIHVNYQTLECQIALKLLENKFPCEKNKILLWLDRW